MAESFVKGGLGFEAEEGSGPGDIQTPPGLTIRLGGVPANLAWEARQFGDLLGQVLDADLLSRAEIDRLGAIVPLGGIVKAEGLGDGPLRGKGSFAMLRLTTPPARSGDAVSFAVLDSIGHFRYTETQQPLQELRVFATPGIVGPTPGGSSVKRFILCVVLVLSCSVAVQAATTKTGGALAADEVWTAAAGPYSVTGSIIVPDGCTLTVEPGVTVYLDSGVSIIVADGGRLLAEGTETQGIRFASPPDSSTQLGRHHDRRLRRFARDAPRLRVFRGQRQDLHPGLRRHAIPRSRHF